jgi:hypothetical protein
LRIGAALLAAAFLLAPAIWNRFPLLQYDTGGYLARWYEGTLVPSRPGAYGLLLTASAPFDFWPALVVQAAFTVWILALTLRLHKLGGRPGLLVALCFVLACATTLPWLTSILLTDIFAGLSVLALHFLVMRADALSRSERLTLFALVAFAAATHSATFVVLLGLALAAVLAHWLWRDMVPRSGAMRALIAIALGIALTLAANFAVTGRIAWTPGGIALSFGRMLQDGIVSRYLRDHCPDPALKLCVYRTQLPRDADEWFWGSDLFDQLGRFAGLDKEMEKIALGALREYPGMQIKAAVVAAARQLVFVASGEGVLRTIWHTYAIIDRYTPQAAPAMHAARQQTQGIDFTAINRLHRPVAYAAMLMLPLIVFFAWRRRRFDDVAALAGTVMLALLANAAVCGILSNPHDRYGARMVWLAVLAAGLWWIGFVADRRSARLVGRSSR